MNLVQSVTIEGGWGNFSDRAESERHKMAVEFLEFVKMRRADLEAQLLNQERNMRDYAPFARAGLDTADSPERAPLSVIEFASMALDVMATRSEMEVVNDYYRHAVTNGTDGKLAQNTSSVHVLFNEFLTERVPD